MRFFGLLRLGVFWLVLFLGLLDWFFVGCCICFLVVLALGSRLFSFGLGLLGLGLLRCFCFVLEGGGSFVVVHSFKLFRFFLFVVCSSRWGGFFFGFCLWWFLLGLVWSFGVFGFFGRVVGFAVVVCLWFGVVCAFVVFRLFCFFVMGLSFSWLLTLFFCFFGVLVLYDSILFFSCFCLWVCLVIGSCGRFVVCVSVFLGFVLVCLVSGFCVFGLWLVSGFGFCWFVMGAISSFFFCLG